MGGDWWVDKLKKYQRVRAIFKYYLSLEFNLLTMLWSTPNSILQVRKKLVAIDNNADLLAETEMKRFMDDQAKAKRMKEREFAIKNEASTARRALLQARQFVDEFS